MVIYRIILPNNPFFNRENIQKHSMTIKEPNRVKKQKNITMILVKLGCKKFQPLCINLNLNY